MAASSAWAATFSAWAALSIMLYRRRRRAEKTAPRGEDGPARRRRAAHRRRCRTEMTRRAQKTAPALCTAWITQICCLQTDKIWYSIQTPYLTQLAKHSHLYWLDCLLLGVALSWAVNSFPSVTRDWPRHTHTQTWQSS